MLYRLPDSPDVGAVGPEFFQIAKEECAAYAIQYNPETCLVVIDRVRKEFTDSLTEITDTLSQKIGCTVIPVRVLIIQSCPEPEDSVNGTAAAQWHNDTTPGSELSVVVANLLPTEFMGGAIQTDELGFVPTDNPDDRKVVNFVRKRDDSVLLETSGITIEQALPGRGRLVPSKAIHRAPLNTLEVPVKRLFAAVTYIPFQQ